MADIVTDISRNKNWNARKGVNNPFTITFTSSGSAFNISGYTFSLQVRNFGSSTNLVSLTQGSGLTNNGAAGTLVGSISAANLTSLSPNDYYWQLTVVQPDTYTYVLLQGRFSLFEETYTGDATSSVTLNVSLTGSNVAVSLTLANSTLPRVYSTTTTATLTVNVDSYDQANVTALASALTIANPTGTPSDGQGLLIRIDPRATAYSLTFGDQFNPFGAALPTTTQSNLGMYIGAFWNAAMSKWDTRYTEEV